MSDAQFDCFRDLAKAHAGIALLGHKRNMVYRRVSKRLAALGLKDFGAYRNLLSGPDAETELQHFVNVLTTNKTEFFRENHHFQHLASVVLPSLDKGLAKKGSSRLRIWSAGCSSGQEPYSVAMALCEAMADLSRWDAKILATDIDTDVIEFGRRGIYSAAEVQSIPTALRSKFVEALPGETGSGRMSAALRSLITFNQLNLHGPWPMKGKFDAIFCRNVIIYFDTPDQCRLFDRFADLLCDGGYVYIGHSESLYKVTERFRPIGQSIYQRIA
ncbi:MAG: protein-glutamate O-methyltransferase CheR [Rhizobiales bacterium]|nr:protein-glutamate O-methyltransferase CheR [Hyphomicrobiales bacterium]